MIAAGEHRDVNDAAQGADVLALSLPPQAAPYLACLRTAVSRYGSSRDPSDLEYAFAAARLMLAELMSTERGARPELEELRCLARTVPPFGELLSLGAGEAEQAVHDGTRRLWRALGLRSPPPSWTASELDAARMAFACACAPDNRTSGDRLQAGLRQLAAHRIAQLLCAELTTSEQPWCKALSDRYGSVRHRYARRTPWRSRGLAELIRTDEPARAAVTQRLERWIADGGRPAALAGELEAALVHTRTPAKFA